MARCSWPQCPDCESTYENDTGNQIMYAQPIPKISLSKVTNTIEASSMFMENPEDPPLFTCTLSIPEAENAGIIQKTNSDVPENSGTEAVETDPNKSAKYNMKILSVLKEINFDENHDIISKSLQAKVHVEKISEQNPHATDENNDKD